MFAQMVTEVQYHSPLQFTRPLWLQS